MLAALITTIQLVTLVAVMVVAAVVIFRPDKE